LRRLVLDNEAITALARGDDRAKGFVKPAGLQGDEIVIPAIVVAEATRRHANLARVNLIIRQIGTLPTTEHIARTAARIMDEVNMTAVVDAIVVAEALESDQAIILTGDYDDLSTLAGAYQHVKVRTVQRHK
jgi:predicted nucleic acid-binding protein